MRVLVTGSSGFIGARLARFLRKRSLHEVIGVDPRAGPETDRIGLAADRCAGEAYGIVFHLGAMTDVEECERDPIKAWNANVLETLRLSRTVAAARFVYANSVASLDPTRTVYGHTKAEAAWLLQRTESAFINVVMPNVYGPGGRGVANKFIFDMNAVIFGDGKQVRYFTYVDDVAELLATVGTVGIPRTVAVSGERINIRRLAALLGRKLPHAPARPFDVEYPAHPSTGKVRTSLREGLRKTIAEGEANGRRSFADVEGSS